MNVTFVPVAVTLAVPGFAAGSNFATWASEVGMASAVSQAGCPNRSPRAASRTRKLVGGDVPIARSIPREVRGPSWGREGPAVCHVSPLWCISAVDFFDSEGQVVHALEPLLLVSVIPSPGGKDGVRENACSFRVKLW